MLQPSQSSIPPLSFNSETVVRPSHSKRALNLRFFDSVSARRRSNRRRSLHAASFMPELSYLNASSSLTMVRRQRELRQPRELTTTSHQPSYSPLGRKQTTRTANRHEEGIGRPRPTLPHHMPRAVIPRPPSRQAPLPPRSTPSKIATRSSSPRQLEREIHATAAASEHVLVRMTMPIPRLTQTSTVTFRQMTSSSPSQLVRERK